MAKIDNKKMWAAIKKLLDVTDAIKVSLSKQGLQWNGKEIVSIEPKPFKIEAGKWYVCIEGVENFSKGCLYKSNIDDQGTEWITDDTEHSFVYGYYLRYFRPATEEEIPHEPKFKVGDWIVGANNVFKIISLNNELNCYIAITPNNEEVKIPYYFDNGQGHMCSYHLWTIQDAKAGDVLVCPNYIGDMPFIFIFKNIKRKDNDVFCYCSFFKIFMTGSYVASADPTDTDFYPATNEQRILLFVKMKEEGYMWLSDKRQLVELLFKEGDTVRKKLDGSIWHISYINENGYWDHHNLLFPIENQNEFELVEPELTPSEVTKESDQELTELENESQSITFDKTMNWDKIRVQAAIAAMQGMLANATLVDDARLDYRITIEQAAVSYANTLVEELKKKG